MATMPTVEEREAVRAKAREDCKQSIHDGKCWKCHGSGCIECHRCKGSGKVRVKGWWDDKLVWHEVLGICRGCKRGIIGPCHACKGTGELHTPRAPGARKARR